MTDPAPLAAQIVERLRAGDSPRFSKHSTLYPALLSAWKLILMFEEAGVLSLYRDHGEVAKAREDVMNLLEGERDE